MVQKTAHVPCTFKNTVKCECGLEILMVPDLKAMSNAIETHVLAHVKKKKDSADAIQESERIWNLLIVQVLEKASNA
jgi:hypothetical protein